MSQICWEMLEMEVIPAGYPCCLADDPRTVRFRPANVN
jgi:hypothetical protein